MEWKVMQMKREERKRMAMSEASNKHKIYVTDIKVNIQRYLMSI